MRRALRLAGVGAQLAAGWLLSVGLYPLLAPGARRALRAAWARGLLRVLGVQLRAGALRVAPGALVVINHVSWLDAVVLHALLDCAMVAKADTRRWPLIGGLLARNDTIFVERRPCRALLAVNAEIGARLARGERVVVFPEGTTTDGGRVLAFRAALFEPAARGAHPVHAFALAYRDGAGRRCPGAAYIDDMSLWQSLCRIAALPSLTAELSSCGELPRAPRRREAARRACDAVRGRLGALQSVPDAPASEAAWRAARQSL